MDIRKHRWDFYRREEKVLKEDRLLSYKYLIYSVNTIKEDVYYFMFSFRKWFKMGWSLTRTNNRCLITSRSRGVFRLVKLSRMTAKMYLHGNTLHSIRKAVW